MFDKNRDLRSSYSEEVSNIKIAYFETRDKVFSQLKESGCCEYVNNIANGSVFQIKYLEYLAIKAAYCAYIQNEKFRSESQDYHRETGEYWIDINKKTMNGSFYVDFRNLINEATNHYAQLQETIMPNNVDVHVNGNPLPQEDVERMKSTYDKLIEEANQKAAQIESDAQKKAEVIIADAEEKQKNLIAEGERAKQTLVEEGRVEKQQIINNITEQQYKESIEKRIKDHFAEEQLEERNIRKNLEDKYNSVIDEKNSILDGMNKDVQTFHSTLMLTFDDAFSSLQNIQNDIHNQIDSWQRNLYKCELKDLAMCFMNLNKIVASMDEKVSSHIAFGEEGSHKEIAEELGNCVRNLKILKNNFEASLARNSIKLLIPQEGDSFNPYYHNADNVDPMTELEDSFSGRPIKAVSHAGIVRVLNSGDDVIQRAIVTVEK